MREGHGALESPGETWAWLHPSPEASAPPEAGIEQVPSALDPAQRERHSTASPLPLLRGGKSRCRLPSTQPRGNATPRPRQVLPVSGSFAGPSGRHLCCQGSCCVLETLCPLPRGPTASSSYGLCTAVSPPRCAALSHGGCRVGRPVRTGTQAHSEAGHGAPVSRGEWQPGGTGPRSQQLRVRRGVCTHTRHRGFCASLRPCQGLEENLFG